MNITFMMHIICMTKSPTYGVMISVPALLPAQNVHLATKRGHPRSVPVIWSKSLVRSIVWDYLRSAMQATNSQTFLATSYLRKMTDLFSNGRYLSTLLVFSVLACHPPT